MKYFIFSAIVLFLALSINSCTPKEEDDDIGLDTSPNTFVANLEGESWSAVKREAVLTSEYLTVYGEASNGSLITLKMKLYNYEPAGKSYVLSNLADHFAAYDNTTRLDSLIYWSKNNPDAYGQSGDIELTKLDEVNKLVSGTFKFRAFNNHTSADYLYLSQGAFTDIAIVDNLTIDITGLNENNDDSGDGDDNGDDNGDDTGDETSAWTQTSDFPGVKRNEAVAFTYNNEGFVGLGTVYPDMYGDFYKYSPSSDSWTSLSDYGGVARRSAVAFVLGNFAYVGLGYGDDGGWSHLNDFWKYDMASDTWSQLNDFPATYNLEGASSFVVNSKAYVVLDNKEVYEYEVASDSWIQKSNFTGTGRKDAAAFVIGTKAYYGTGYDDGSSSRLNDFWEYNSTSDIWTQKADFPSTGRNNASGFAIGSYGYIGMGNDLLSTYNQIYKYDPSADSWVQEGTHPFGSGNGLVSFVIGNVAYLGTGYISNQYQTRFYKFEVQ